MKTDEELIVECAHLCGFDPEPKWGLSGKSERDRLVYVEEFPCGEALIETVRKFMRIKGYEVH